MNVGQMKDVGDLILSIGEWLDVNHLSLFPLEHLEEFLHGQKFAVGAGDRHDRHGAAWSVPDIVRKIVLGASPGGARTFAFRGQEDASLAVDREVVGRITAIHLGKKVFFDLHVSTPRLVWRLLFDGSIE